MKIRYQILDTEFKNGFLEVQKLTNKQADSWRGALNLKITRVKL